MSRKDRTVHRLLRAGLLLPTVLLAFGAAGARADVVQKIPVTDPNFSASGLAIDFNTDLFVAGRDNSGGVVEKVSAGGKYTAQKTLPFGHLNSPRGVAVDDPGNEPDVFVLDFRPAPEGPQVIELPGGSSTPVTLPVGTLSSQANQIAADDAGDVFVADDGNHRVVELAHGASSSTVLPISGLQGADGVAVYGNTLAVADETGKDVIEYNLSTNAQTTVSLPAGVVPGAISFDHYGNLYVFDKQAFDVVEVYGFNKTTHVLPLKGGFQSASGLAANGEGQVGAFYISNVINPGGVSQYVTSEDPPPTISSPDFSDGFGEVFAPVAVNDPNNIQIPITYNPNDNPTLQDFLGLAAISSNPAVIPAGDVSIRQSGVGNSYTVNLHPIASGTATVTIIGAESPGYPDRSLLGTLSISVQVAPEPPDSTVRYYLGAANASSAIAVGGGYWLDADDDSAPLRLYQDETTGYPISTWELSSNWKINNKVDFEAMARHGSDVYDADSFAEGVGQSPLLDYGITGSGANTDITYKGDYYGLEQDLINWDNEHGQRLGIEASSPPSDQKDESGDGLALEGLEFAPDEKTAYLAMRVPLEPTSGPEARTKALIVPVTNFTELFKGNGTHAQFGEPILMDLEGVGIREIRKNADNQYLILTGPCCDAPQGTAPKQALWEWDGVPADAPVKLTTNIMAGEPFLGGASAWEGIVEVPDPLVQGSKVTLVQDDGKAEPFGRNQKNLNEIEQRDASKVFTLDFNQGLSIATTSLPGVTPDTPYSTQLAAIGGVAAAKWKLTGGELPAGLKLKSNGELAGTVKSKKVSAGTYTFTVIATAHLKKVREEATATYTLSVS